MTNNPWNREVCPMTYETWQNGYEAGLADAKAVDGKSASYAAAFQARIDGYKQAQAEAADTIARLNQQLVEQTKDLLATRREVHVLQSRLATSHDDAFLQGVAQGEATKRVVDKALQTAAEETARAKAQAQAAAADNKDAYCRGVSHGRAAQKAEDKALIDTMAQSCDVARNQRDVVRENYGFLHADFVAARDERDALRGDYNTLHTDFLAIRDMRDSLRAKFNDLQAKFLFSQQGRDAEIKELREKARTERAESYEAGREAGLCTVSMDAYQHGYNDGKTDERRRVLYYLQDRVLRWSEYKSTTIEQSSVVLGRSVESEDAAYILYNVNRNALLTRKF